MILTTQMLITKLSGYHDPFGKIRRLCKEGKLYQITKGLYETERDTDGKLLSCVIYGPSYLSFSYALSHYGLIPERVYEYTCATCGKGKKKHYHNFFGDYSYRDIPISAFPFETKLIEENGYAYVIATPEKALCDRLYELPPINNQSQLKALLFEDLRIDNDEFLKLNSETIENLSKLYHNKNVKLLSSYLRRQLCIQSASKCL